MVKNALLLAAILLVEFPSSLNTARHPASNLQSNLEGKKVSFSVTFSKCAKRKKFFCPEACWEVILTLEGWTIFLSMTYVNLEALEALRFVE